MIATSTATLCGYLAPLLILTMRQHSPLRCARLSARRDQRQNRVRAALSRLPWRRRPRRRPRCRNLRVPPTNFIALSPPQVGRRVLRTIEHGVVFSPMHSWQGTLTETERHDALAYIRFLVQQVDRPSNPTTLREGTIDEPASSVRHRPSGSVLAAMLASPAGSGRGEILPPSLRRRTCESTLKKTRPTLHTVTGVLQSPARWLEARESSNDGEPIICRTDLQGFSGGSQS